MHTLRTLTVMLATGLLLSMTAPTQAASVQLEAPPVIGVGGECDAIVHVECGHITADGTCHLYIGLGAGGCVVWGGPQVIGVGGECSATVHLLCGHITAPSLCIAYVGLGAGGCVIW